ncbi:MAG TPA: radical SAM family heme chaperone HemW [Candidatus Desulfobacillus sp.]|nr:radical SAM family heme chaperone HemW [Candidatus Desulfobacillus sp.]
MARVIPIAAAGAPARLASPPPLSLYIHFPWCVKKCPYCDFNSHEARAPVPEARYLAALIADLEQSLPLVWGRPLASIFIGGGTPSLMAPETVDALLGAVRARLTVLPGAEITLEANPGTAEAERFGGYRQAGVNRLSLGVQSLNPRHLAALGRIHDERQARRAVELALRHFDNVNIDLMYALPGQTLAEARADITEAAAFGAPHLSAYHLTLEPNTAFFRAPPPLPDDDLAARMQDSVEETLAARGYRHYEVSAFARGPAAASLPAAAVAAAEPRFAGSECRHNFNYWLFGDYLGIGPGAHGKLSTPATLRRTVKHRHPQAWLAGCERGKATQEERAIADADLPFEFMMNALRLSEGFPPRLFAERTGLPLASVRRQLDAAAEKGLLLEDERRIAPSARGRRFLNDLLQIFLPDSAPAAS